MLGWLIIVLVSGRANTLWQVALVLGMGPGIGGAVARKWAKEGFAVACVARTAEKATSLAQEIGNGSVGFSCDVTDPGQLSQLVARVEAEMGDIECMVYNASKGVFKNYEAVTHDEFRNSWATDAFGLLAAAQLVCPKMAARGRGVVAITGATASLRGKPMTVGFASGKAAQRSVAQSLARELGPKGVHVFLVIVDGMVDLPATRARMPTRPDGDFLSPAAIAQTYWDVASQPPSCWTFEMDVRPNVEPW